MWDELGSLFTVCSLVFEVVRELGSIVAGVDDVFSEEVLFLFSFGFLAGHFLLDDLVKINEVLKGPLYNNI